MNGSQLAKVLSDVVSLTRQDLDESLKKHLATWVKANLMKGPPTVEKLRKIHSVAGDAFISWHLASLTETNLIALAKKLDPHLANLASRGTSSLRCHLDSLIGGRIEPSPKPVKLTIDQVLELKDSHQRRKELDKLTPADLRKAIRRHDINIGSLSRKPSKTELIEHIQAAIDSGWPSPRSILGYSKY